jgi:ribosomal protein S18 acetylase RimI-like enzyme
VTLAERVQAYLRGVPQPGGTAGGLALAIREDTPSPFANYAMPLAPDGFDLEAARAAMAARGRALRLEWVAEYAPGLEDAARAAGLALELRTPVMTAGPEAWRDAPAVPGLAVERVGPDTPDDVLVDLVRVQEIGFGTEDVQVGLEDVAGWRDRHGYAALGRVDGVPAGGAAVARVRDGLGEVVGVATLPAYRRRGIAAALTADVAAQAFAGWAELLVLTPGDEGAQRIYARAGFAPALTMLHYRTP